VLAVDLVHALGFVLRVFGSLVRLASRALLHFYDLLVVLPLMAERLVKSRRGREPAEKARPLDAADKYVSPF
jgi:hypothetical protein